MPVSRTCTFCGNDIEPGTGKMYVRRDGNVHFFCSGKCQKNQLGLGRVGRKVRWTRRYVRAAQQQAPRAMAAPEAVVEEAAGEGAPQVEEVAVEAPADVEEVAVEAPRIEEAADEILGEGEDGADETPEEVVVEKDVEIEEVAVETPEEVDEVAVETPEEVAVEKRVEIEEVAVETPEEVAVEKIVEEVEAPSADQGGVTKAFSEIPGIGPATAEALWEAGFTSMAKLKVASEEELAQVKGLGPASARKIRARLEESS